jgi:hypothetical protein
MTDKAVAVSRKPVSRKIDPRHTVDKDRIDVRSLYEAQGCMCAVDDQALIALEAVKVHLADHLQSEGRVDIGRHGVSLAELHPRMPDGQQGLAFGSALSIY